MPLTSGPPYCKKCENHHWFSDACVIRTATEAIPGTATQVLGARSSGVEQAPYKGQTEGSSPPAPITEFSAEEVAAAVQARRKSLERTKRWREANRERYNAYMREYRKRKRDA